jgi:hypothetical protein
MVSLNPNTGIGAVFPFVVYDHKGVIDERMSAGEEGKLGHFDNGAWDCEWRNKGGNSSIMEGRRKKWSLRISPQEKSKSPILRVKKLEGRN